MIQIVQVGNLMLGQLYPGRWGSDAIEPEKSVASMTGALDMHGADQQFGSRRRRVQVVGTAMQLPHMARAEYRARGLVGSIQPVVGYALYGKTAVWLENRGRISALKVQPDNSGTAKINIDIELLNVWQPLNRLLWRWGQSGGSTTAWLTLPDVIEVMQYPTLAEWGVDARCGWAWQELVFAPNPLLNPANWWLVHDGLPPGYPVTGVYVDWNSDSVPLNAPDFSTARDWWTVDPVTIYALRGMDGAAPDVTITIERWDRDAYTLMLSMAVLDDILDRETGQGLGEDDLILTGNLTGRVVVVRNNRVAVYGGAALGDSWRGLIAPGTPSVKASRISVDAGDGEWSALFTGAMQ